MAPKYSRKAGNLLREADDHRAELRSEAADLAGVLIDVTGVVDGATFALSFRVDDDGEPFALELVEVEGEEDDEEE
jgi:hypothetical protein